MARKGQVQRARQTPKFRSRRRPRCSRCGRARACYRKFQICRICFREMSHRGEIPGITKASW
jgi:small subunit ribosomal protein S14